MLFCMTSNNVVANRGARAADDGRVRREDAESVAVSPLENARDQMQSSVAVVADRRQSRVDSDWQRTV
jgi:hypothetical protein